MLLGTEGLGLQFSLKHEKIKIASTSKNALKC